MPSLDLGQRRVAAKGEPFVVKLNPEDSDDGLFHEWKLPRVITQSGLRKISTLAQVLNLENEDELGAGDLEKVTTAMDSIFEILFGTQAEDAAKHLGPEDIKSIMDFYGLKLGESSASSSSSS